jgi:hypothetical protein
MITFEQIKSNIIKTEKEWIKEIHGNNEEGVEYIQGTIDDINNCKTISDLVYWYNDRGYDNNEAYEIIISDLMKFGSINK